MRSMEPLNIDFSELNHHEATVLKTVLERQKQFEGIAEKKKRDLRLEIQQLEMRIDHSARNCTDKHLCTICFKAKISSSLNRFCQNCSRRTCSRCGQRNKQRMIWSCMLCLKKHVFLTSTGEWYTPGENLTNLAQAMLDKLGDLNNYPTPTAPREAVSLTLTDQIPIPQLHHVFSPRNFGNLSAVEELDDLPNSCDEQIDGGSCEPEYLSLPQCYSQQLSCGSVDSDITVFSVSSAASISGGSDYFFTDFFSHEDEMLNTSATSEETIDKNRQKPRKKKEVGLQTPRGRPLIERLTLTRKKSLSEQRITGTAYGACIIGGISSGAGLMGAFVKGTTNANHELFGVGDQILEWNHIALVDATYEDTFRAINMTDEEQASVVVCHRQNISQSPNVIPLVQRQPSEQALCKAIEEQRALYADHSVSRSHSFHEALALLYENQLLTPVTSNCSNPTPTDIEQEEDVQSLLGKVQLQLWYDEQGSNLIIRILNAHILLRGQTLANEMPNPYAIISLLPNRRITSQFRTPVVHGSLTPSWNLSYIYTEIEKEELTERPLEVVMWSERKVQQHQFLGKVQIDLSSEYLCNNPVWFSLEKHSSEFEPPPIPMNRRHTFTSYTELEPHSSDTSPSLSSSRRTRSCIFSSFHTKNDFNDSAPSLSNHRKRRASSSVSKYSYLRGLLGSPDIMVEDVSRRTVSFQGTPLHRERRKTLGRRYSESMERYRSKSAFLTVPKTRSAPSTPIKGASQNFEFRPPSEFRRRCQSHSQSQSSNSTSSSVVSPGFSEETSILTEENVVEISGSRKFLSRLSLSMKRSSKSPAVVRKRSNQENTIPISPSQDSYGEDPEKEITGPGQIRSIPGQDYGYLRVGLAITQGSFEIDVIRAIALPVAFHHPDTYVKTYLLFNGKKCYKRKTSAVSHDSNPVYNCKVKYAARDVYRKILHIGVWTDRGRFGRNALIGETHIAIDCLNLRNKVLAWYKLFIQPDKPLRTNSESSTH